MWNLLNAGFLTAHRSWAKHPSLTVQPYMEVVLPFASAQLMLPTRRRDLITATLEPLLLQRFQLSRDAQGHLICGRGTTPPATGSAERRAMSWPDQNRVIAHGDAWARHFGYYRQLAWLRSGGSWIGLALEHCPRPDGGMDYDAVDVTAIVPYARWLSRLDRGAGVLHLGPQFDDAVLTRDQLQVLRLMTFGYSHTAIAERLQLTVRQVRNRKGEVNAILFQRGLRPGEDELNGPLEGAMRQSLLPFVMANPDWFSAPDVSRDLLAGRVPDLDSCLPMVRFHLICDRRGQLVSLDPEGCAWLADTDATPWDVVGLQLGQLTLGCHAPSLQRYRDLLYRARRDGRASEHLWTWTGRGWQLIHVDFRCLIEGLLHAECTVLTGALPFHHWINQLDFESGALGLEPFFPGQVFRARLLDVYRGNLMGLPSPLIAQQLHISQGSVKKHLADLHSLARTLHISGQSDYRTREVLHHTQLAAFIAANPGWLEIDEAS